ncbi:MAG: 50S ribosomal protein L13 [Tissierellia bacterium]|nr:50S ribosomal protein L13 [Tissierellia bacterium]
MKTYMAKPHEVERKWLVIDAEGMVLGRLATEVASILRGKKKPIFTPHVDTGDYVIVLNADKIVLTGKKLEQKRHYHHTGYPGGLRSVDYATLMEKHPERAVYYAVKGMLPKNALGRKMIKKMRVYRGEHHDHEAQQPEVYEIKGGRR